jgi:carbonic anhydrase
MGGPGTGSLAGRVARALWRARSAPLRLAAAAVFSLALLALAAAPAGAESQPHAGVHWTYTGDAGPAHWGDLSADYKACSAGHEQSPIDIERTFHASSAPPLMRYGPTPLKIVNNGHTVQVNYAPGSSLVTDGKTYQLVQFHFHSPSEHRIEGKAYAMEVHLVHRAEDGSLAVVALLLKEGAANPFLETIWPSVPAEADHEVDVPGASVDVADLMPERSGFLYYEGSLTTPPCSEGVRWFVMDATGTVSKEQVARFLALVHENARPVQPLGGRQVEHRM